MDFRNKMMGDLPFKPPREHYYQMTPSQVRRWNLTGGMGNDFYGAFGNKLGIACGLAIAAFSAESTGGSLGDYGRAIWDTGTEMAFSLPFFRVGMSVMGGFGASLGNKMATAATRAGWSGASFLRGVGVYGGLTTGVVTGLGVLMAAEAGIDAATRGHGIIGGILHEGGRVITPELGGNLFDTAASATMRRRSLNAMKTSRFNQRSILGNEAMRLATGY